MQGNMDIHKTRQMSPMSRNKYLVRRLEKVGKNHTHNAKNNTCKWM